MIYVVGSGPAGVACSYALVKKGYEVTMLDAGIELEPEIANTVEQLHKSKHFDPQLLEKIKGNKSVSVKGVRKKLIYGSDYPYKEVAKHIPLYSDGVVANPTFAKGGLSSVWGASVMPYRSEDIKDWPISLEDLSPYYASVLKFINIAAGDDDLISMFPLYTEHVQRIQHSKQALSLLKDLNLNRAQLNSSGIFFGSSRLAAQISPTEEMSGCVYCGLCLHGCPHKLIYNSAFTVAELSKDKNFRYIRDVIVEKVNEESEGVIIIAYHKTVRHKMTFKGSAVFLACGALISTKIMLESGRFYNYEITLKDSQYFLFHLLRYKGVEDVTKELLHTLAQLNIEIFDKDIDQNSVHIQLYTYSDLYENALRPVYGLVSGIVNKQVERLMSRIIIGQGYLHSNSSSTISVRLEEGSPSKLILKGNNNKRAGEVVKAVLWKLFKNRKYLNAIPLIPLMNIGSPGEGNHIGGSFPMSKNPKQFQTDIFGRPFGYKKVYIVDASVFPSISAQTITLTTMANAYRIADQYIAMMTQ
jgi:choline dehydrogenase-like flavoprotein